MSFKDDISEAKSKELNYFHKANEDFADDIIESNKNCWSCHTEIPVGKKYCEIHCGHPSEEFDSFTGQCKGCGKSLNVNMMMTMPSTESKATEAKIERGNSSMKIDGKNVIKIWESMQGWYWYAVEDQGEYTGVGADGNDVQAHAWFGYVQADFNEWGTFDSKELERAGVWTVPKSNWGWTGRMEESKASEYTLEDLERVGVDWDNSTTEERKQIIIDTHNGYTEGHDANIVKSWNELSDHTRTVITQGKSNESKASEDVTFAGRGDIVTYEDLWDMLDFGSRLSIAYGHIMNQTSDNDFAMFIINSEPEQLSDNHRDWIKSAIDGKGGIDQVKQSMGIESKASEDLTFAGRGELNTIQDVWNAMSNDSRYSLMYQLGHDSYGSSTVSFVNGQELTVTDMQKVIDRDEFPDHLLGNIDVEHMKRVAGLESKASEARKLNARQKKLIEEWVGSMSSPPMMITSDDLPYSLLSELRDINDFDGFDSAIMRYASDIGNKQAMQGSNPYMHSSNYGSFESKASESTQIYAELIRFSANDGLDGGRPWALVSQGKNKDVTRDEGLQLKNKYNMDSTKTGYSGYIDESEFGIGESEDVMMYDGNDDDGGVREWWDFELPLDEMKHEQLSSILGIDVNTAWGFMTPAEQERVKNYKLNRMMTNEAQLMKEINDGWEFSVIDHGYGGGNKIDGVGNSPDVGLLEVGIFSPDTDPVMGVQKSAVQGYMTQADVDGLLSTFRTDPAVAFRSIGGEWTFDGQKGLEYQSHYSDMSDITWRDIETMEGSLTLLERNMWLENRFDEITPEDFRRLADTARED